VIESLFPNGIAHYLVGGLFIGLGVAVLYAFTGRQGGASTFFSSSWSWLINTPFFRQDSLLKSRNWRLIYAVGFILGGVIYLQLDLPQVASQMPAWKLLLGGILIGYGSRLGGGCTSGHGICGMASLNLGSISVVVTFMATGFATAWLMQLLGLGV
jgi:hypothetical protein